MRDLIPDKEVEELKTLFRQLPSLTWEASNSIKTEPAAGGMTGSSLDRFRRKEAAVASLMGRIRQIVEA